MKPVDYRNFRFDRLKEPEYRHILLLLYWPIYGLAFLILERFSPLTYHLVTCPIDKYIPFCEFFLIPYFFWFIFIAWIMVYSFFFDIPAFKKFSIFVIITYTVTCIIYVIYPTMQELRPDEFVRDNIFTTASKGLYSLDTNTNVCPSVHILGSMAVLFTAWNSERYGTAVWRTVFTVITVVICASTLFMKQHSVVDVACGLVLSFAAYPFVWRKGKDVSDTVKTEALHK